MANALFWLWYHQGYLSEGRGWYERALAQAPPAARTAAQAWALGYAGYLAWAQGDHPAARRRLEESVEIWRELGGGQGGLAHMLWILALEMLDRGEPAAARTLAEESVGIFRTIGVDQYGLSISLATLGGIVLYQRDHALATSLLEESVAISRKAGDGWMLSRPLRILGVAVFQRGDHDQAAALFEESLTLLRRSGDKLYVSRSLECLAAVDAVRGDRSRAVRLFGAGEALREAMGASVLLHLGDYDGAVAAARDHLSEEAFAAAWAEGRAMTLEEAVDYALEEPPQEEQDAHHTPTGEAPGVEDEGHPEPYPDGLTAREAEVLGLLASGKTNKQIASELVLSVSTVQRHVANVYVKIGARRRAEATAYALRRGIARARPEEDPRGRSGPPG